MSNAIQISVPDETVRYTPKPKIFLTSASPFANPHTATNTAKVLMRIAALVAVVYFKARN